MLPSVQVAYDFKDNTKALANAITERATLDVLVAGHHVLPVAGYHADVIRRVKQECTRKGWHLTEFGGSLDEPRRFRIEPKTTEE